MSSRSARTCRHPRSTSSPCIRTATGWSADLTTAAGDEKTSFAARVDLRRRQIEVRVPAQRLEPGQGGGAHGGRRRPVGRGGEQLPAAGLVRERRHAGRCRRGVGPGRVLQRRLPHREPFPRPDRQRAGDRQRRVVARPGAGQRARGRRHLGVLRQRRLRQARAAGARQQRRAEDRRDGPHLQQPLRAVAGRGLQRQLLPRRRRDVPGPVPGTAPAVRDLHPREADAAARLRAHAPAALAVGELQPVPRDAQPVAVRRARRRARS